MNFNKITSLLCLFLLSASLLCAQDFVAHRGTVSDSYNFWFFNPEEGADVPPPDDYKYPLLIFLHGKSLSGNDLNKVRKYGVIDAFEKGIYVDAYIIAPQLPSGPWDPHKVMKIVDWAIQNYHVDPTRVCVYGMSLGGYGAMDLAATYPDRISCAMPMCGGGSVKDLTGLSKVPLWIMHGTADELVPVSASDRVVDIIKSTGDDSRLIYTRLQGVNHGKFARAFYMYQTYDWLFSHSTQDPGRPVNRQFEINTQMLDNAYQEMRGTPHGEDDGY